MKLLINNPFNYHYEILESLVLLFPKLINKKFNVITLLIKPNKSFENYFKEKYPNVTICYSTKNNYHYVLHASGYLKDIPSKIEKNIYYIIHENLDYYDLTKEQLNQTISLTPLSKKSLLLQPYILPFHNVKTKSEIPIFIIQGNFDDGNYIHSRRNLDLLEDILAEDYQYDFKIKLLGRGNIPNYLKNHPKVSYYEDLNFEDFHKEFLDAYAIIPCIDKETHPQYYLNKYTSSISYGIGYDLYFLIDKDLNEIYHPIKKVIYQDDISIGFNNLLIKFYQENNNN